MLQETSIFFQKIKTLKRDWSHAVTSIPRNFTSIKFFII